MRQWTGPISRRPTSRCRPARARRRPRPRQGSRHPGGN